MLKKIVLGILLVMSISEEIARALPDGASNLPGWEENGSDTREGHKHRHRAIASASSSEGRIIFPGDDPSPPRLTTRASPHQTPMCTDSTFCEEVPNYPEDLINNALKARRNEFQHLVRVEPPAVVGQRAGAVEPVTVCDSQPTMTRPQVAKSIKDEWLFIVNTKGDEEFEQSFRVEICRNANSTCNVVQDHFSSTAYVTECKQQYMTHHALSWNKGDVKPEFIVLPSSCCCHLKYIGDGYPEVGSRIGESMTRKTTPRRRQPSTN